MKRLGKNSAGVKSFSALLFFVILGYRLDPSASMFSYRLSHPFHETTGVAKTFSCTITRDDKGEIQGVTFYARMESFDSGNASRDAHMLEATESLLFPSVLFSSTSIIRNDSILVTKGLLTFHGVTKDITFLVTEKTSSKASENITCYSGKTTILLSDFKIEKPVLFFIPTSNELEISFSLTFSDQDSIPLKK